MTRKSRRTSPRTSGLLLLSLVVATASGAATSAARDNFPPTVPAAFAAKTIGDNAVRLNWEQSLDNFGVEKYHLMRNGAVIARTKNLTFVDTGLQAGNRYTYDIMADDGENYSYVSRIIVTLPVSSAESSED